MFVILFTRIQDLDPEAPIINWPPGSGSLSKSEKVQEEVLWRIVFVRINIFIKYIYRNMCFTIMAPESQLICQSRWRKSTNPFGPKMRQLF
jgi:hypothetical protein